VIEARVRHRTDSMMLVDMMIGAGPLRKQFSTAAVLHRRMHPVTAALRN